MWSLGKLGTCAVLGVAALGCLSGCRRSHVDATPDPEPQPALSAAPAPAEPAAARHVLVVYSSEKQAFLEEQIDRFNKTNPKLASGTPFTVEGKAMGSGEAMQDILDGHVEPAVFSPASDAYLTLLNDAWLSQPGHSAPLAPHGDSVVISPVVIAIWKPMAQALGWPKKALGWSDVLKVSQNAKGWADLGRAEWGRFKLGHTHPEYSNSGLLSFLAEAYAGAQKTRDLTLADLAAPKTRSFVTGIERSIVHYGKSTGFFSEKMLARGPAYLSAAVLYENSVVESYAQSGSSNPPLVAIYPREGTFWSDHPYSILEAPWAHAEEKEGAALFLAQLKARPAQERALALGFRPADPGLPVTSPIDAEHGCDPKQPQTTLSVPSAEVLKQLLSVFREVKKPSVVTLVFDKSGSMSGKPLSEAQAGAQAFLEALQPRDQVGLEFFDNQIYPLIGPLKVGENKAALAERVAGVTAGGGTALYDAISASYRDMRSRADKDPGQIHALVVMTDGNDESSKMTLEDLKAEFPREAEEASVKVFTIAYGAAASGKVLEQIAEAGEGSHNQGTVQNIVQVYRDIASFF
ncbi:MAG TPA: VWA domain-containing protein [Polyangiaceae bacterium]|nr:VWA domain-containing protein [Polyangiaceae bacterium]